MTISGIALVCVCGHNKGDHRKLWKSKTIHECQWNDCDCKKFKFHHSIHAAYSNLARLDIEPSDNPRLSRNWI